MTHGLAGVFARKIVEVERVVEAHLPFWLNQSCKWNTTKKLHQLLLVWCMCALAVL
jgi:uncharacterized membrane protein